MACIWLYCRSTSGQCKLLMRYVESTKFSTMVTILKPLIMFHCVKWSLQIYYMSFSKHACAQMSLHWLIYHLLTLSSIPIGIVAVIKDLSEPCGGSHTRRKVVWWSGLLAFFYGITLAENHLSSSHYFFFWVLCALVHFTPMLAMSWMVLKPECSGNMENRT